LLQEARAGNRLIVVIDEAQNLDPSVLETVRLLSDFETPQAKLMHIILSGQPELADKLASPGLSQLRQRVSILHGLEPLPSWEIKNYVEHRLKIAGYQGDPIFTADAYEAIADFTEGIPRNINNFCFNALSLTYALQKKLVDSDIVKEVISDLDISRHTTMRRPVEVEEEYYEPPMPGPVAVAKKKEERPREELSPSEAAAYMQEVALKLKNWQQSMDKTLSSTPRRQRPIRTDG